MQLFNKSISVHSSEWVKPTDTVLLVLTKGFEAATQHLDSFLLLYPRVYVKLHLSLSSQTEQLFYVHGPLLPFSILSES